MRIDGRVIAEGILTALTDKVKTLKKNGVVPKLAVIVVGDNPASISYIKQKQIAAEKIGSLVHVVHVPTSISPQELDRAIQQCNMDTSIHGLIIQRPLPLSLNTLALHSTRVFKDVDGFLPYSPYVVPVAAAVFEILKNCKSQITNPPAGRAGPNVQQRSFFDWLKNKTIVVIGRGETAGKPIANAFLKQDYQITTVHSQTFNPDEIIKSGDIVITCVGISNIVRRENIKKGSILIGVGIRRNSDGKLHGDFDEEEIKDIVSYYTPTPGGVGPVNVACLMQNLVLATQKLTH